jgi:hypothetical protein
MTRITILVSMLERCICELKLNFAKEIRTYLATVKALFAYAVFIIVEA